MLARQRDVADADLGLHRAGTVDDDDAARRRRRLGGRAARRSAPLAQLPNARSAPANASSGVTSPTIARMALLAPNQALWNATRSSRVMLAIDLRRAGVRPPVGMEPVDEPIEDDAGDVIGILVADLQAGEHLLPLALDLLRRERRVAREVRRPDRAPSVEAVLHHHGVDERQIAARAGADRAADRVDRGRRSVSASCVRRALIEQRRGERRDARLVRRILRAAGADDQPQADRRLLVVRDGDDLQAVGERPHLVGRELDVPRRQRPRRTLGRPVGDLRGGSRREPRDGEERRRQRRRAWRSCIMRPPAPRRRPSA